MSYGELEQVIRGCRARGDLLGEAEARAEKAQLHSKAEQWVEGAQEMHWAARLAMDAGSMALHGQYLYGKGTLLAEAGPSLRGEALSALRKAAAAAQVGGNMGVAHQALRLQMELHAEVHRWDAAAMIAQQLVKSLEGLGPSLELIDLLRTQALMLLRCGGDGPKRALRVLARSEALASSMGQSGRALQARLDAHLLAASMALDVPSVGELVNNTDGPLLAAASAALFGEDHSGAVEAAERARAEALDHGNAPRYLAACLLLAEAHEELGEREAVLDVLLTCRATLTEERGADAAVPAIDALDALRKRWGEEAVREALDAYGAAGG
ncbi:MAG TPA: hypothetical protein QGF58_27545 [Myxococcota bacterium]|nr:hypothetical protein [Myxococcota bacterium]